MGWAYESQSKKGRIGVRNNVIRVLTDWRGGAKGVLLVLIHNERQLSSAD